MLGLLSFPTRRSSDLSDDRPIRPRSSRCGDTFSTCRISRTRHVENVSPQRHYAMIARMGSAPSTPTSFWRSEEHTSEHQSPCKLVCRLLLKKNNKNDR